MKRLLAPLILSLACGTAQAEDILTLEVDNQSDHAMTALSVWAIADNGEVMDDPLFALVEPIRGHMIPILPLSIIRCFDHVLVSVTYDDGHEAEAEVNQCEKPSVVFNYYP